MELMQLEMFAAVIAIRSGGRVQVRRKPQQPRSNAQVLLPARIGTDKVLVRSLGWTLEPHSSGEWCRSRVTCIRKGQRVRIRQKYREDCCSEGWRFGLNGSKGVPANCHILETSSWVLSERKTGSSGVGTEPRNRYARTPSARYPAEPICPGSRPFVVHGRIALGSAINASP